MRIIAMKKKILKYISEYDGVTLVDLYNKYGQECYDYYDGEERKLLDLINELVCESEIELTTDKGFILNYL